MYMHGQIWSKKKLALLIVMVVIFMLGMTLHFINLSPLSIFLKRSWCSSFLLENSLETSLCLEATIYSLHRYTGIRKKILQSDNEHNQSET